MSSIKEKESHVPSEARTWSEGTGAGWVEEAFPNLMLSFTASVTCQVEPVGRWFEAFIKRRNIHVSASFQELEDEKELSEESGDEELQLEEFPMLKTLDPKDWKVHYLML